MKKMMGGGSMGNKSVMGSYQHKISKSKSMIGSGGGAGGRKSGGKQGKMCT